MKNEQKSILEENDKYIGQLFLTIDYSAEAFNHKVYLKPILSQPYTFNKDDLYASLSVGVLRATGLQIACDRSKSENSSVFVKFSLNFLSKPQVSQKFLLYT